MRAVSDKDKKTIEENGKRLMLIPTHPLAPSPPPHRQVWQQAGLDAEVLEASSGPQVHAPWVGGGGGGGAVSLFLMTYKT